MLLSLIKEKYPQTVATLYTASNIPDEFDRARANSRYAEIASIIHAQTTVLFVVGGLPPTNRPNLKMIITSKNLPGKFPGIVIVGPEIIIRDGIQIATTPGGSDDPVVRIAELVRKLKTYFQTSICAFEIVGEMSDELILMALLLYYEPQAASRMGGVGGSPPTFGITLSDSNTIFSPGGLWSQGGLDFVCNYLYATGSARIRYLYPTPGVVFEHSSDRWSDLFKPVLPTVKGPFYEMEVETVPPFIPSIYALSLKFVPGKRPIIDCDTLRTESLELESVKKGPKTDGSIYWGLFDTRRVMAVVWYVQYLTGDTRVWLDEVEGRFGLVADLPIFEARLDIRFPDAYHGADKKQLIPGKNRLVTIPPPFKMGRVYVIPIHRAGPYTDEYDFSFVTSDEREGANNMAPKKDRLDPLINAIGGIISTVANKFTGVPASPTVSNKPLPSVVEIKVEETKPIYVDRKLPPETEEEKAARKERVKVLKEKAVIERAEREKDEKNKVKILEEKRRKAHETLEKAKKNSLRYDYVYAWGFRYHAIVIEFEPEVEEKTRIQALAECYLYHRARFSNVPSVEEVCAMHILRARGGEAVVREQLEIEKAECTDVEVVSGDLFEGTVVDPWIYYCLSRRVLNKSDYLQHASIFEFGDVNIAPPGSVYESGEISVFQLSHRKVRRDETVPLMLLDRLGAWTTFGETKKLIEAHYDMLADLDWHFPTGARASGIKGASFTRTSLEFHFETKEEAKTYARLVAERLRTPSKFIRVSRIGSRSGGAGDSSPAGALSPAVILEKNVFVPLLISFENQ